MDRQLTKIAFSVIRRSYLNPGKSLARILRDRFSCRLKYKSKADHKPKASIMIGGFYD